MLNNCYRKKQKFSCKNEVVKEISNQSIPVFSNAAETDTNKVIMNNELNFMIENALQQVPLIIEWFFLCAKLMG